MQRAASAFVLGLTALSAAGCPGDGGGGGNNSGELQPFRDDWRVEADLEFPYGDPADPGISSIQIGGHVYNDNFINQGDVIVKFDGPPDRIKIELRRFTMTQNPDIAQQDFDAIQLWAFNTSQSSPKKPGDMDPEANCTTTTWLPECAARVYYDGLSQLARAGADMRVTLPANYRHSIDIITDDSDADSDYFNRGDVCVENINASAQIELENGEAYVIMAPETPPIPACTAAEIEACDTWEDADGPAAWSSECDCVAIKQGEFGSIRVDSVDGAAANITIDAPADLWMTANLENQGEGQSAAGEHCTAEVRDIPDFTINAMDFPWQLRGSTTKPSEKATEGAGYSIQAFSTNCGPVAYTDHPEDFVGPNLGTDQPSEERGNITLCAGCLRSQSCDQLIP